tara:strand:- start:160 stop:435 length:276 start_codon:yes stop_codon:yes gene_type:complete
MAKKEKVVDLKPKTITEKELQEVQAAVSNINKVQLDIGMLESRKHVLLHNVTLLQEEMQSIQKKLEAVYGKVNININDGTIADTEDEQADS